MFSAVNYPPKSDFCLRMVAALISPMLESLVRSSNVDSLMYNVAISIGCDILCEEMFTHNSMCTFKWLHTTQCVLQCCKFTTQCEF